MNEDIVEETMKLPPADVVLDLPEETVDRIIAETIKEEAAQGTVKEEEKPPPHDMAAGFFSLQKPKLQKILDTMSAKQLRRMVMNACSYPFTDRVYAPRTEEEKQAAYLISEMVLNKTIMTLHFEMTKAEEAIANGKIQEETTLVKESFSDALETIKPKEENNGKV